MLMHNVGDEGLHGETDFRSLEVPEVDSFLYQMVVHQQVNREGQGRSKWRNAFYN